MPVMALAVAAKTFCVAVNPAAKTKLNQSGDVTSVAQAVQGAPAAAETAWLPAELVFSELPLSAPEQAPALTAIAAHSATANRRFILVFMDFIPPI